MTSITLIKKVRLNTFMPDELDGISMNGTLPVFRFNIVHECF